MPCALALAGLFDLHLDLQAAQDQMAPVGLQVGAVKEHLRALVWLDEAIAPARIKPLDDATATGTEPL